MGNRSRSAGRRIEVGDVFFVLALVLTAGLLVSGLLLPAFTNDRLFQDTQSFSILGAALRLGQAGSYGLMVVVVLFSAVFPAAKLVAMFVLWLLDVPARHEKRGLRWLEMLGKWSMLDVFVIATVTGASHLKLLNKTTVEPGIYVFGLSILLSLLISIWLRQRLDVEVSLSMRERTATRRIASIMLSLASLLLFIPGLVLPLMSIEKWIFWDKQYSLIAALPAMAADGEWLLPLVLLVFVVVLPLARFIALTIVRARPSPRQGLIKLAYGLEKWTMWEVYALALVVVAFKLGDFVDLDFLAGFWCILLVAPLAMLDGWLFERDIRFRTN